MAHNAQCSNATGRHCVCSCGGALHGGGGQRLDHGPWGRSLDYDHNGYRTHLGQSLDGLTVGLFDGLFKSSDGELVDRTSDLIGDEIASFLGKGTSERIRKELRKDHTICSLMVAMVHAMTKLRNVAPDMARRVIERTVEDIVMQWPDGVAGRLNAKTAGKLAKRVVAKFQDTTSLGSLPLYIKTCRCVAIASCPDPANHYDVRKYCAEPLVKDLVSQELRHLWTDMIDHWHDSSYHAERPRNVEPPRHVDLQPPVDGRARGNEAVPSSRDAPARQRRGRFFGLTKLKRRWPFGRE
jgi:hypothetical protein